jgi:hypothetical protein
MFEDAQIFGVWNAGWRHPVNNDYSIGHDEVDKDAPSRDLDSTPPVIAKDGLGDVPNGL